MSKTKDALKFFQVYIKEMIDIGGENLPKAISSKLGAKLGKMYKDRGLTLDIETALKQIYLALNGKPVIKQLNENRYEVIVKYSKKFCPIAGAYNPSRAPLFQDNICIPYTRGFLNELFPQFIFGEDFLSCIPLNNQRLCHYILKIENKKM
ncbi:MAG: hypothetical protein JSV23_03905 [Promethearchaeota archaeon]|nr:MAG: hypothetical protein JSV23_03905 [Candidatus Lokiarchaeota archaeon]